MTAPDAPTSPRWMAKITYRHDDGPRDRLFTFEELHELHDIVECGPNFYAIVSIMVVPNPSIVMTVEEGEAA